MVFLIIHWTYLNYNAAKIYRITPDTKSKEIEPEKHKGNKFKVRKEIQQNVHSQSEWRPGSFSIKMSCQYRDPHDWKDLL